MIARFERSDALRSQSSPDVVTLEAEWFQLTYGILRIAPEGAEIAHYDPVLSIWSLLEAPGGAFSDIVFHN